MIFIIILGSVLHFTFALSDYNLLVGAFSAVNESVWEHLKLGFWPALFYAAIEYRLLKELPNNFLFAKAVGIYVIPIAITVMFYSYTAVLGEDLFIMDIMIFILAVIIGQIVSYKLLTNKNSGENLNKISLIAIIILGLAFVLFTYYPPELPPFRDPISGEYGITNHLH